MIETATSGSVRDRILQAALSLFVQRGFYETSMPDIVEASGTSTGAVYHHFKGKDELAKVLHQQTVAQFVEMSDREVLSQPTAHAQVSAYVAMMFRLTEEMPEFVSYLLYTRPKSAVPDNLTVCSREGMEVTAAIIDRGVKAGEIRADLNSMVLCGIISGTLMRLIDLRLDRVITVSLNSLTADTTEAIWAGIRTV